jgi:hypothetical protein
MYDVIFPICFVQVLWSINTGRKPTVKVRKILWARRAPNVHAYIIIYYTGIILYIHIQICNEGSQIAPVQVQPRLLRRETVRAHLRRAIL